MDDTGGGRGNQAKGVDVGHDIVSPALLLLGGNGELIILDNLVGFHLLDGFGADRKSKLCSHDSVNLDVLLQLPPISVEARLSRTFLSLREPGPKLSPCGEALPGREEVLHLIA